MPVFRDPVQTNKTIGNILNQRDTCAQDWRCDASSGTLDTCNGGTLDSKFVSHVTGTCPHYFHFALGKISRDFLRPENKPARTLTLQHSILVPLIVMVLAGAERPADVPIPVPRPDHGPAAKVETPVPSINQNSRSNAPDVKTNPPATITAPQDTEAALKRCESELENLGVDFERLEPVTGENGCGIASPYAITTIAPGVTLKPATELRCETALSLARWVEGVALPSTKALPDSPRLRAITHGSTYVCRRRNNLPTGKISEHSIGNAIDIVSFEFEGREPIAVTPRSGKGSFEEAFQRAVRAGACLHFTTVLGPGADASHDNHLHFDIAKRKRGYRLCQ